MGTGKACITVHSSVTCVSPAGLGLSTGSWVVPHCLPGKAYDLVTEPLVSPKFLLLPFPIAQAKLWSKM